MTLNFAYGSNMLRRQFLERCPHSDYIANAVLVGYKFAIVVSDDPESTASGYATVKQEEGSEVHGVLCALTPEDEEVLDGKEDVAKGDYVKMECTVKTKNGEQIQALVYVNGLMREGTPQPGYIEKIVAGARSHGLPAVYLAQLASWAKKAG